LSKEEKKARHIHSLPANLREATLAMMESDFMKEAVGEHIFERYTTAKMEEWNDYTKQVTDWEISQYLYKV
ncbi:MAG: type I glutamate--ammonia ligase, partial [Coprococcus sp.]